MRSPQTLNISFKSQAAGEPFRIRNADLADDLFEAMSLLQSEESPIISLEDSLEKGWDETKKLIHAILDNLGRIPEVLHVGVPVLMKVLELLQTLRSSESPPREKATIWTGEDESLEKMLGSEVGNLEALWERAPQVHLGEGCSPLQPKRNAAQTREG